MTLGFDVRVGDRTSLSASAGALLGGMLHVENEQHAIGRGPMLSLGVAHRVLEQGEELSPFVLFGASFSGSTAPTSADSSVATGQSGESGVSGMTREGRLTSLDARFSITVGRTFWQRVSPYAAIRAFAGPIFFKRRGEIINGTDRYHYQAALGLLVSLPAGLDLSVEGAPLGERRLMGGLGVSF